VFENASEIYRLSWWVNRKLLHIIREEEGKMYVHGPRGLISECRSRA
jgi:hypothetical protein